MNLYMVITYKLLIIWYTQKTTNKLKLKFTQKISVAGLKNLLPLHTHTTHTYSPFITIS